MPRIKKKHRELKKFVGKRKNPSVSAPSVPAEQFSTSVLAEQLSVIEVGVKKLHMVYAANNSFYGGASPQSPRGSYATVYIIAMRKIELIGVITDPYLCSCHLYSVQCYLLCLFRVTQVNRHFLVHLMNNVLCWSVHKFLDKLSSPHWGMQ